MGLRPVLHFRSAKIATLVIAALFILALGLHAAKANWAFDDGVGDPYSQVGSYKDTNGYTLSFSPEWRWWGPPSLNDLTYFNPPGLQATTELAAKSVSCFYLSGTSSNKYAFGGVRAPNIISKVPGIISGSIDVDAAANTKNFSLDYSSGGLTTLYAYDANGNLLDMQTKGANLDTGKMTHLEVNSFTTIKKVVVSTDVPATAACQGEYRLVIDEVNYSTTPRLTDGAVSLAAVNSDDINIANLSGDVIKLRPFFRSAGWGEFQSFMAVLLNPTNTQGTLLVLGCGPTIDSETNQYVFFTFDDDSSNVLYQSSFVALRTATVKPTNCLKDSYPTGPNGVPLYNSLSSLYFGSPNGTWKLTTLAQSASANNKGLSILTQIPLDYNSTILGLVSSNDYSAVGQSVTFTASLTWATNRNGLNPSGNVIFQVDGNDYATVPLSGTKASVTIAGLSAGDHTITARYVGDSNFLSSTSTQIYQHVKDGAITFVQQPNSQTIFASQTLVLTSKVATAGTASYQWYKNGQAIPGANSSVYTIPVTGTGDSGTYYVNASSGGSNLNSSSATVTVIRIPSLVSLFIGGARTYQNPVNNQPAYAFVDGDTATLTAKVSSAGIKTNDLTGTVTFIINGVEQSPVNLVNGIATLTIPFNYVPSFIPSSTSVVARYNGDSTYDVGSSDTSTNQVYPKPVTITSQPTDQTVYIGQTATFSVGFQSWGGPPTFSMLNGVTWYKNGVQLPSSVVSGTTLTLNNVTQADAGDYYVVFTTGNGFTLTSNTAKLQVKKYDANISLSSDSNPGSASAPIKFTATLSSNPAGSGVPADGTVTFSFSGLGSVNATVVNGTASVTRSDLPAGTTNVTAVYGGNATFNASPVSSTLSQAVYQAPSIINNPVGVTVVVGQSFTLTGSASGYPAPTLSWTKDTIATGVTVGTYSVASASLADSGSYQLIAENAVNKVASSAAVVTVNQAATSISANLATNSPVFGQAVTVNAQISVVAPGKGNPSGSVIFTIDNVDQTAVNVSSGNASLNIGALAVGNHTLSARYSGDTNFKASTLATPVTFSVSKANTSVSVSASPNPSTYGQTVNFTASVSVVAPGAGSPSDSITFSIDGQAQANPVPLSGNAASFSASLPAGQHSITAVYSGDNNFNASPTSNSQSFTVNKAATTLGLVSSASGPSFYNTKIDFTTTVSVVSPAVGTPTGNVTYSVDNSPQTPIALNGTTATFSISNLSPGSHTIGATYNGDSNFQSSTATPVQVLVIDKPKIVSVTADKVTPTAATLTGTINANYDTTQVKLEWGTSAGSYPNIATLTPAQISGGTDTTVTATLSGLTPNTYYYYRLTATNTVGTVTKEDKFRTAVKVTDFNSFTFNNTVLGSGGGTIEGRIAAGGSASFTSFKLATTANSNADNLIVGQDLTLNGGQISGNAVYGGVLNRNGVTFKGGNPRQVADPLELANTLSYVRRIAQSWKAQGGTSVTLSNDSITLNAKAGLNYFQLKGSDFASVKSFTINGPSNATVIINVSGTNITLGQFGLTLRGGITAQQIVYNFYETTNLAISSTTISGTIWAPEAAVAFTNGKLDGGIVANSLTINTITFTNLTFTGALPEN